MAEPASNTPKPQSNFQSLISWAFYDWANSAFSAIIETFIFATYFVQHVTPDKEEGVAQWGLMLSLVGFLIAIGGPFIGAIADHSGRRKVWLAVFAFLCILCTGLMWFVTPNPSSLNLALILMALATIGSEFSYIFYNAMLPALAGKEDIGRWSGWGWSLGYLGGVVSLVLCLFAFVQGESSWFPLDRSSAQDVRATFVLTAVWYLVFSLPILLFTPADAGPHKTITEAIKAGLKQTWDLFLQAKQFGPTLLFLIARMIYTDGLITLFAFGGMYAAATFGMSEHEILLFGIFLNITAGIGAWLFAIFDDKLGSKKLILISLMCLIFLSSLALLSVQAWQFWTCGLLLGLFVGPVQASSRAYLARVAPEKSRNQMFGFFALTGRATSFIGPLMVSSTIYWTDSLRLGMTSILVFFIIGALLMIPVPRDK